MLYVTVSKTAVMKMVMKLKIEGLRNSKWLLMDYGDIVVHIFDADERNSYNLEKLWSDMPRIDVSKYLA